MDLLDFEGDSIERPLSSIFNQVSKQVK